MKTIILGHTVVVKDLDTEITDNSIDRICHDILIGADEGFIAQNSRSFYWEIEQPSVSTSENIVADYQIWWDNEGSGIIPTAEEDTQEFINRVSKIAWSNGSYKTSENAYLSSKVAILEEKDEVIFEHEQMIYKIWSCDEGYMYDSFDLSDFSSGEELESTDGGCCTGTAYDAVHMAIE